MNKVITRFPPSPTGHAHIGNIRTLLFNYLYTRQKGGEIVMRFEDTDLERSKDEYKTSLLEALNDLGLDFDHGPFHQTQRTDRYIEVLKDLIEKGFAYEGEESNDGTGKVVRFKNPNKDVTFNDGVRGDITINTTDFEDFIIARSINNPLYHFAVVIDDIDGNITHVIRGEDHITSTPRQILLFEALGVTPPHYTHLPLIIGEDKKKLGKRHGATSWLEFKKLGYLPGALLNYLALLGWNPGDEREIFTKEELIKEFSIERIQKSPAMFSYKKLDDINKEHIKKLSFEDQYRYIFEYLTEKDKKRFEEDSRKAELVCKDIIIERIAKFSDVTTLSEAGELDCYFERPIISVDEILFKTDTKERTIELLESVHDRLKKVSDDEWNKEYLKMTLWDWSGEVGRGSVLHPLRTLLSGRTQSPDPFTIAGIIGKTVTLERINTCVTLLV